MNSSQKDEILNFILENNKNNKKNTKKRGKKEPAVLSEIIKKFKETN
jgi:hypothetical protein